ncbi:PGF-CTERM sorting domain-containing protein [Natronobacterium texcoconense]|nr:PGF-CTERM sorting domain-containing protein [Natronobacterium texcoconense]
MVAVGAVAGSPAGDSMPTAVTAGEDRSEFAPTATLQSGVSEEEFVEPVPEEGDPYFEAEADDGSWISYVNPRDAYRSPYLGEGSGKLCVTLLNENGDPVVGESVPGTTVTVETGEELEWHSDADPFVVEYPLPENYDRPLDADQFGTTDDLPQGDGYLDSHCLEWHGLPEDETVNYGEVEVEGENADDVEVVGYVQQAHDSWDSDVDPIEAAEPYEEAGGWTYYEGGSHGQAVVVLQLDGDGDATGGETDDSDGSDDSSSDDNGGTDSSNPDDTGADETPGFGAVAVLVALLSVLALRSRPE